METRHSPAGQPQHPDPVAAVRAAFGRAVNEVLPVLDTAHRDGLNHVAMLASVRTCPAPFPSRFQPDSADPISHITA